MDATGYSCWFERLLAELDFEVWIGDPAEIKAKRAKKQKTDRQDAQLLLKLFPAWNISACNARPATKDASWITWDLTLLSRVPKSLVRIELGTWKLYTHGQAGR